MTVQCGLTMEIVKDVIAAARAQPGKLNFAKLRARQLAAPLHRGSPGHDGNQSRAGPYKGGGACHYSVVSGDIAGGLPQLGEFFPISKRQGARPGVTSAKRCAPCPTCDNGGNQDFPDLTSADFRAARACKDASAAIVTRAARRDRQNEPGSRTSSTASPASAWSRSAARPRRATNSPRPDREVGESAQGSRLLRSITD